MFRTALLSTLTALGLVTAATAQVPYFPSTGPSYRPGYVAQRPDDRRNDYHRRGYEVEYRTCRAEPWRTYTVTRDHDRAHDLVRYLERRGYQARVDH